MLSQGQFSDTLVQSRLAQLVCPYTAALSVNPQAVNELSQQLVAAHGLHQACV